MRTERLGVRAGPGTERAGMRTERLGVRAGPGRR